MSGGSIHPSAAVRAPPELQLGRRLFILVSTSAAAAGAAASRRSLAAIEERGSRSSSIAGIEESSRSRSSSMEDLVPYIDERRGFRLLRPARWRRADKDGAAVLFQDPSAPSANTLGVVVTPVRISSLNQFGSAQFVADKLLRAERSKESTNSVELLDVESRLLQQQEQQQQQQGVPEYTIEYLLDSSRGVKRVFSTVTIASNNLYILNLAFDAAQPIPPSLEASLRAVATSLDLVQPP